MTRQRRVALVVVVGISGVLGAACRPPAALEGEPRARFGLQRGEQPVAGGSTVSAVGNGLLAERTWDDDGLEQRVILEEGGGAHAAFVAGRSWQERALTADGGVWRHRARVGLSVERKDFARQPHDVVGLGGGLGVPGFGASLASWWRHTPGLLATVGVKELRFVDVASGTALPLRIEPRGAAEASRDGHPVAAHRWFAWTPAFGVGVVTDEAGELLALEGLAGGRRAVREGASVPLAPRPPLEPGVAEVRLVLEDDAGRFDAALTFPAGASGPLPGVLLLAGSGPADVDGNLPGLRLDMYRRLAASLSAAGLAVLRYEKPGTDEAWREGAAAAEVPDADALLARARSALSALAARPEVRADCLFLVGHSEGGMLAPELALQERSRVRGLVMLASPARELLRALEAQLVAFLEAMGASDEEIARARSQHAAHMKLLRHGRDVDLTPGAMSASSSRWLKSHLEHVPAEALARLDVPVLAVFGGEDVQVLDETEVEPMRRALAHLPDAEVVVVPDMDHLLMPAHPLPGPGRYGDSSRRHSRFIREDVPRWIVRHGCQ